MQLWLFFLLLVALMLIWNFTYHAESKKEGYRDPIYLDPHKMATEWYPRSNWTIYGYNSQFFGGYPYYSAY